MILIVFIVIVEEAGGKALPCILDVRDEAQIKSVVKKAVEKVELFEEKKPVRF